MCEMYVIKSYLDFHNPNKGPATSSRIPVELEGLIDAPDIGDMNPNELQFDVPTARNHKQELIEGMLKSLPDQYGFCIDLISTDMNRWAQDTTGAYAQEIQHAVSALRHASGSNQHRRDTPGRDIEPTDPYTAFPLHNEPDRRRPQRDPRRDHGIGL